MAGVPHIMQVMLDAVTPQLKTGRRMLSKSIELARPEGEIADLFAAHQKEFPDVSMGSYPFVKEQRFFGTHLVLRSTDPDRLAAAFSGLEQKLAAKGYLS
jgi:molybdopterin-biosynthesis enzyme MoeA-like protein